MSWTREQMAERAAAELQDGDAVNLGIGIPTLVANYIGDRSVMLQSENGILGMGPFPAEDAVDPQIINAGKQTVTIVEGGSVFDSTLSFAMIRGGHVDVAILGAMEVAQNGDIANWQVPGEKMTGMGGAMDLVSGARRLIVITTHTDKHGKSKLVDTCVLPLTGVACVDRVVTDLGVFDVVRSATDENGAITGAFRIVELAPNVTIDAVRAATKGRLLLDA